MKSIRENNPNFIWNALVFFLGTIIEAIANFLYGNDIIHIVGNTILSGILFLTLVFVISRECVNNRLMFDNANHMPLFYTLYFVHFLGSLFFPLFDSSGWPILLFFVSLTIVSNEIIGFAAGFTLLTSSLLISSDMSIASMVEYVAPGLLAVLLFSTLDEEFKVVMPLVVSLFAQLVALCAVNVLFANKLFGPELFIFPVANVIICAVLLLIILKILSSLLVYKEHDRYMDILDPEFELLTELKNCSKEEYNHTIYTAVLCSKLALKLNLNEPLTKACGYYHRIGIIRGDNSWESVNDILNMHDIPQEVGDKLSEYLSKDAVIKSKEIGVLLFADAVISSVTYLFSKDKNAEINYQKLINTIFDKKLESGILSNSDVSFSDIRIMRQTLIDEKLFYDFLR